MTMAYALKVPAVIAKTPRGSEYVYHPAPLPEDTDADQVKAWLAEGLIEETEGLVTVAYDDVPKSSRAKAGS